MTEEDFIRTVAPRIGGKNAISQLNPVQQGALIELLIRKNIITRTELDDETFKRFKNLANTIMTMPIQSPIQQQL